MESGKIINILRVDPRADVTNLIDRDLAPVMRRFRAAPDPDAAYALLVRYTRSIYEQSAALVNSAHRERVGARLDAAHDRAEITAAIRDLRNSGDVLVDLGTRLSTLGGQLTDQSQACFRTATEFGIRMHQERQTRSELAAS